jgi:hypothetical protein
MNVISVKLLDFTTLCKVTDGVKTTILEFKNDSVCGLHPFTESKLSVEQYEALQPDTEHQIDLSVILDATSSNLTALFTSYNA